MNAAYFHIVLVHIPIVLCPLGVILLVLAHYRHSMQIAQIALGVVFAASIVSIPVFLLGEPAEEIVEHIAGISENTIEQHEEAAEVALWITLAAGALSLITWICISVGSSLERACLALTFFVASASSLALAYAGHKGGAIRHPEAFSRTEQRTE